MPTDTDRFPTLTRRGFIAGLAGVLAATQAPAIIRFDRLMAPRLPPTQRVSRFKLTLLGLNDEVLTQLWVDEDPRLHGVIFDDCPRSMTVYRVGIESPAEKIVVPIRTRSCLTSVHLMSGDHLKIAFDTNQYEA